MTVPPTNAPADPSPRLGLLEQLALALSFVIASVLLIDPFVLERARILDAQAEAWLRFLTDVGTSGWILIPSGTALAVLIVLGRRWSGTRLRAATGWAISVLAFVFVAVAGSGLIANLAKGILGRARPKLYEWVGPLEFSPFSFRGDYASFPSGHATTCFALAAVIAILWPRARVLIFVLAAWAASTRFLIGAHYFTDVVAGALFGTAFTYWVRGRFAARRWLFEPDGAGGYRLRGRRVPGWAGKRARERLSGSPWPEGSFGHSDANSPVKPGN